MVVDEVLLSRLKEFVIKEISLSHTLQDQSATTRPKRMGHPAREHPKGMRHPGHEHFEGMGYQSADIQRGWDILSVGPNWTGHPSMWASREGEVPMPGCPERADHPASRYPEGREDPVLSGLPAFRHPEMMGIQFEGTLRGWDTEPVGVLRVGILRPVLQNQ